VFPFLHPGRTIPNGNPVTMGLQDKMIVVNGATSQYDRRLAVLDAEYAKVEWTILI